MKKLEQVYEGKAKKVYRTDDPEIFIVDYKDDATAFNGEKKGTILGKGAINNRMTNYFMRQLEKTSVPNTFRRRAVRPGNSCQKSVDYSAGGDHPKYRRRFLFQTVRR